MGGAADPWMALCACADAFVATPAGVAVVRAAVASPVAQTVVSPAPMMGAKKVAKKVKKVAKKVAKKVRACHWRSTCDPCIERCVKYRLS